MILYDLMNCESICYTHNPIKKSIYTSDHTEKQIVTRIDAAHSRGVSTFAKINIYFEVCKYFEQNFTCRLQKNCTFANYKTEEMSEKEINAYRLTSMEEPTDEMLAYIMHEVAEEANRKYDEAIERYFKEIASMYQEQYGDN